jgi:type I restriction enzyme M protein
LFKPFRENFDSLVVSEDKVRDTIYSDPEFSSYADNVEAAFERWKVRVDKKLKGITGTTKPKHLIVEIAEAIIEEFETSTLLNKYDAYEVLLSYWNSIMADDIYLLVEEGYKAIRDTENITKTSEKKKKDGSKETKIKVVGWEGKLVPKTLVTQMFYSFEQKMIDDTDLIIAAAQVELDELIENAEDGSVINDILTDKGTLSKDKLKKELKARTYSEASSTDAADEDTAILLEIAEKIALIDEKNKLIKELKSVLDDKVRKQYEKLKNAECLELLLERKWYNAITSGIYELYTAVNHRIADRISELNERYEETLPMLESKAAELEGKVKSHLERMGFEW